MKGLKPMMALIWLTRMNMSKDIAQGLQWLKRPSEFDRDHQVILLACSREKYLWSSYTLLERKCGLKEERLDDQLHYLCKIGVLYIYISEDEPRRVFFALRERVEESKGGFLEEPQ